MHKYIHPYIYVVFHKANYFHFVPYAGIEGCGMGPNTVDSSLPPTQPWSHITDAFGLYNLPIEPSNQVHTPNCTN